MARRPTLPDAEAQALADDVMAAFNRFLAGLVQQDRQRRALAMAPSKPRPGGPVRYLGIGEIAKALGVEPATVSAWLVRYDNTPPHDGEIGPGRHGVPERGWLPERVGEWRTWMSVGRPGQGGPGQTRARRKEPAA